MIAGLLRGEFGDRGKDTVRVASEHNNILRLGIDDAGNAGIRNEFDWVRAAGVFRDAHVVVVGYAGRGVVHDVFEDGAETNSVENFGFLLPSEVDAFSVATTLDIEYTGVGPNVFIVANELPAWVGGEGAFGGENEGRWF